MKSLQVLLGYLTLPLLLLLLTLATSAPVDQQPEESSHQILVAAAPNQHAAASNRGPSVPSASTLNLVHNEIAQQSKAQRAEELDDEVVVVGLETIEARRSRRPVIVLQDEDDDEDDEDEEDAHLRVLPLNSPAVPHRNRLYAEQKPSHERAARRQDEVRPAKEEAAKNVYREPVGGFGIGWNYGGQGAGHGFHVPQFIF